MKILSLGVGTQSTVIYFMSSMGILPRVDYAIFADPGSESEDTYKYLHWLIQWSKDNNGIEIRWCGKKSIYKDLIHGTNTTGQRFASIPVFTKNEDGTFGILRRQCTNEYKIAEVLKEIRVLYGLKPRQRFPLTEVYSGITIDEIERMNYSFHNWQTMVYPLCGYVCTKSTVKKDASLLAMTKNDCIQWFIKNNLPVPPKSACFFCPYQSNSRWLQMKRNKPVEWEQSVKLDYAIRDSSMKGVTQQVYLHRDCVPLDKVNFNEDQTDLFMNECRGGCGI